MQVKISKLGRVPKLIERCRRHQRFSQGVAADPRRAGGGKNGRDQGKP